MAFIRITGKDERGIFKTEIKRTPVLITELIRSFPKMTQYDIQKALEKIRESAERDERVKDYYVHALKKGESKSRAEASRKLFEQIFGENDFGDDEADEEADEE